jgi:bacterioferritin-associated ferredoxin
VYVCICNAVTEDDVRGCVAAGAGTTRQVKQACGWRPGCGSCVGRLAAAIGEARFAAAPDAAAPAA